MKSSFLNSKNTKVIYSVPLEINLNHLDRIGSFKSVEISLRDSLLETKC